MPATNPATRSYLIGSGIAHSISPAVMNAGAEHLGLDWRYELLDVEESQFDQALAATRAPGSSGANVTMPYKVLAAESANDRTASVDACGASNLLVSTAGLLVAHNTDAIAVSRLLGEKRSLIVGGDVVVLGAGGAAAAALWGLRDTAPRSIAVLARRADQAGALVQKASRWLSCELVAGPMSDSADAVSRSRLVINATSLGMTPADPSPVDPESLSPGMLVYDYVYARGSSAGISGGGLTTLQRESLERGASICDGAAHQYAQAGPTFQLLTGHEPPVNVLRRTLIECLGREPLEWASNG